MVKKLFVAKHKGFCFGVKRAIDIVYKEIDSGKKIVLDHEIVHNKHVNSEILKRGVNILDSSIDYFNTMNRVLILSAHGTQKSVHEFLSKENIEYIDAVCPIVANIQREIMKFSKAGYDIIYIGEKKHKEARAVTSYASGKCHIIGINDNIESLIIRNKKIAVFSQTTLNYSKVKSKIMELKMLFKELVFPSKNLVCNATQVRQESVVSIAKKSDLVVVVGSKNSSNSNKLFEVACRYTKSVLIDNLNELEALKFDYSSFINVGLTAGASVPDILVNEVSHYLTNLGFVVSN